MTAMPEYDRGRRCGRDDYRAGRDYAPEPDYPHWSSGYADGWFDAADAATATHGHALACQLAWNDGVAAHERRQPSTIPTDD